MQCSSHPGDQGHASGEDNWRLDIPSSHRGNSRRDCPQNSCHNIIGRGPGGKESENLSFRENHTHTADGCTLPAPPDHLAKRLKLDIETTRNYLQKASCARSAPVIHHKIPHGTIGIQSCELTVLSADIDDRHRIRDEHPDAASMTSDLGNGRIGEAYYVAAIAGCHDPRYVIATYVAILQKLLEKLPCQRILLYALIHYS